MSLLILDPDDAKAARRRLRARDDRVEECWNGRMVVPPLANMGHQQVQFGFAPALHETVVQPGLGLAVLGCNLSDRGAKGWKKNYRCPDVLVYLAGNPAVNHGTHMQGGPDFLVEILSPGECPRAKFKFYARVNTREVLLLHRRPWALELFQLRGGELEPAGRSDLTTPAVLVSSVLPLAFQLVPGADRPQVVLTHPPTGREWRA